MTTMAKQGVYKFYEDCGRMGSLYGVFIATDEEIAASIGRRVRFGEVLGKHSNIVVDLTADNFTLATDDEEFVRLFGELGLRTGHDPLGVLADQDADEKAREENAANNG
jgi:hypothetical protein